MNLEHYCTVNQEQCFTSSHGVKPAFRNLAGEFSGLQ